MAPYRIFFERWARGFLLAAIIAAIAGLLTQVMVFYLVGIAALVLSFVVFYVSRKYPEEK